MVKKDDIQINGNIITYGKFQRNIITGSTFENGEMISTGIITKNPIQNFVDYLNFKIEEYSNNTK